MPRADGSFGTNTVSVLADAAESLFEDMRVRVKPLLAGFVAPSKEITLFSWRNPDNSVFRTELQAF